MTDPWAGAPTGAPVEAPPPARRRVRPRALAVAVGLVALMATTLLFTADQQASRGGRIDGLRRAADLPVGHVAGPVEYPDHPDRPPMGGEHNGLPQACGVYDSQVPTEHAVHSLEHGAVWITYRPDLPADDLEVLRRRVEGQSHRLLSPLPGQAGPVVLTGWGVQLELDDAEDDRVGAFLGQYTRGLQSPEPGAPCAGNERTGPLPFDPPGAESPETTQA